MQVAKASQVAQSPVAGFLVEEEGVLPPCGTGSTAFPVPPSNSWHSAIRMAGSLENVQDPAWRQVVHRP